MENKHEMTNKEWEQAVSGITSRKKRARAVGAILNQGGKSFNPGMSSELGTKGFKSGMALGIETRGFLSGNVNNLPNEKAEIFDKLYEGGMTAEQYAKQGNVANLINGAKTR